MKLPIIICIVVPIVAGFSMADAQSGELVRVRATVKATQVVASSVPAPPTDDYCRSQLGFPCYSPQEMQTAYGLTSLLEAGYNGTGQTIVIIDSFGSPTIQQDLRIFDAGYGLPDPPSFTVLAPLGTVPFNPANSNHMTWAQETSADVEWAHAMAPGANIVVLTSPVNQSDGVQGLQECAGSPFRADHLTKLGGN
jgi:subtilase family serine protease